MKKVLLIGFVFLLLSTTANAAEITLAWDPSSGSDLAGYKLYYGTSSRTYSPTIDVGKVTQYTVRNLQDETVYYFAATAYDNDSNESDYSVELVHRIDHTPPAPPTGLKALIQKIFSWFKGVFGLRMV